MGVETIAVILDLIAAIGKYIVQAFAESDPAKLEKVTDILEADDDLKLRAALALNREEAAREAAAMFGEGSD